MKQPSDCGCSMTIPCDTSTNSPHQVSFAPQAAKASNCQYFAVSSPRMHSAGSAALLLKNPADSNTIFYVTIESLSNCGGDTISASLAENLDTGTARCCDLPVFCTNLGCTALSAANVCRATWIPGSVLCAADLLTQDLVAPLHTLRIDHQGGFVVTPGSSLAIVATSLCQQPIPGKDALFPCIDVGIDLRWWETPCNSHT